MLPEIIGTGEVGRYVTALALATARLSGFAFVFPPLARLGLEGGALRGGVVLVLALPLYPVTLEAAGALPAGAYALLLALVLKEIVLGLALGLAYGVPFWAAATAGDVIDFQHGASAGDIVDPASAEDDTVTGVFLILVTIALFYTLGLFTTVLGAIYDSHLIWPAAELLPRPELAALEGFVRLLSEILATGLLLAAPLVLAMLLVEGMLALISRFVPQLNVFFVALAAKTLLALLVLPLYAFLLLRHLSEAVTGLGGVLDSLRALAAP